MTTPTVLVAIEMAPTSLERLRAAYPVEIALTHAERMEVAARRGDSIGAILTNGTAEIPRALIEALPGLRIVCAHGVGHESVDLAAARDHGIAVTNGAGANAPCVADHAMALLLALLRDLRGTDAVIRAGGWRAGEATRPMATGRRVGILGLGDIGMQIARRCTGFDMPIAYYNRRRRADVDYPYAESPLALAGMSEVLMVVTPGGPATRHLVGAAELAALGPHGVLVNVGRGSVVDTDALIAALQCGAIAGAALDVIEGEPVVPPALREMPNVLLTPHMAGRSPDTLAATIGLVIRNLDARFANQPVLTPVQFEGGPLLAAQARCRDARPLRPERQLLAGRS